jgi:hypothetical protein
MKTLILTLGLILSISAKAAVEIFCSARYQYQIYHPEEPPAYYEGPTIGKVPIAGTGRKAYYETVWSNTYSFNISFYSGYELNEYYGKTAYNANSIIAFINWPSGGTEFVIIKDWYTSLKYMTENEIKYTTTGERIYDLIGYDSENRLWQISM